MIARNNGRGSLFKRLCKTVYGENKRCFTNFPCPDQIRCVVDFVNNCFREYEDIYRGLPIIVLVLESPHRDEYDQSTKRAIRPANGSTGASIERNIMNLLRNAYQLPKARRALPSKFLLYLVEAVSYQCSNNEKPIIRGKRDELFRKIWREFGKDDFERRMSRINPFAVINACTGLSRALESYFRRCNQSIMLSNNFQYMNSLNVLVQISLDSIWGSDSGVDLLYSAHPSSPNFEKKGLFFR